MSNSAHRFLDKAHAMYHRHREEFERLCDEFAAELLNASQVSHLHLALEKPVEVTLDDSMNDSLITGLKVSKVSISVRDGRRCAWLNFTGVAEGTPAALSQVVPGTFYELVTEIEKALAVAMRADPFPVDAPR